MLTEKDYCNDKVRALLKEIGCPLVYETPFITLYEVQKWLREEKQIIVEVFVDDDSDTPITYNIYKDGECVCHHHGKYWSVKGWSEALSEGIKAAVKILKGEDND